MTEQERAFKGIWIPAEIWLSKDLTITEKFLLAEIGHSCYATNKQFAEFLGISENRISHIISNLVKKGYIERQFIYKEGTIGIEKRLLSTTINIGFGG